MDVQQELGLTRAAAFDPVARFVYADWLEENGRLEEAGKVREAQGFVRRVDFVAAWDQRTDDPQTNRGVHGVELRMVLIGPSGAVQFVLYTNWLLPNPDRDVESIIWAAPRFGPMPADLGYHSKKPFYDGHKPIEDTCPYLGGPCYYDGSSLASGRVFNILLTEGGEAVWKYMERCYVQTFVEE